MYLDFVRQTRRYGLRRHPRFREIPRFATCVYHFTLPGVSQVDDEYRLSPTDRWLVGEDHTGFKGHAVSMCP